MPDTRRCATRMRRAKLASHDSPPVKQFHGSATTRQRIGRKVVDGDDFRGG